MPSKAAYVFGLFGDNCSPHLQASLLAAINTLMHSQPLYPVAAMVGPVCATNKVLREQLGELKPAVTMLEVTELRNIPCGGNKAQGSRLTSTYALSAVWSLTMYDVVMMLDSDLAVIQPLDDHIAVMLRNTSYIEARTPLKCMTVSGTHRMFNSGVWALRPNQTVHKTFVEFMQGNTDGSRFPCGIGIQDAANAFFTRSKLAKERRQNASILGLSVANNFKVDTRSRRCLQGQQLRERDVRVVHWSGTRKPQRIRANDLLKEPVPIRIGLFTYMSAYCRYLHLLNATVASGVEACQQPRWMRFNGLAAQSNLSDWSDWLSFDRGHPVRRCASAGERFAACLGVPGVG